MIVLIYRYAWAKSLGQLRMHPVIVRIWIISKKFTGHVQSCSASSISNLTFGGTLKFLAKGTLRENQNFTILAEWD